MADELLRDLARRAGISVEWQDYTGKQRFVEPPVLHSLLNSLGLPAKTSRDLSASRKFFNRRNRVADLPPLVTGVAGRPTRLEVSGSDPVAAELLLESGGIRPLTLTPARGRLRIPPVPETGYHRLAVQNRQIVLAVAPPRCRTVEDAVPDARLWGIADDAQGPFHVRDFSDAMSIIQRAAPLGADALAVSLSSQRGTGNPMASTGSRLFPSPCFAAPQLVFGKEGPQEAAVDEAAREQTLKDLFLELVDGPDWDGALGAAFARYRSQAGPALRHHALFLALQETLDPPARTSWQSWPVDLRDPNSAAVAAFAEAYQDRVLFHEFSQWLLEQSKAIVQSAARQAGMRIGLISDFPLGTPENGSEAWSRQDSMLLNVSIGAPPSAENPEGENWNLATFSPRSLEAKGFDVFIETLRAVMRHTGGTHIRQASGLVRQWLIPAGASPEHGAYVSYPATDLMRLIALESVRHQSIVTADLGSDAPPGFAGMLEQTAVSMNRTLLQEGEGDGAPAAPEAWTPDVVGLTSTPGGMPIRAWWSSAEPAEAERLWGRLAEPSSMTGSPPARDDTAPVVDAAISLVGQSAAPLVLVPIHDLVDAEPLGPSLDRPDTMRRLETLARLRPRY